MIWLIALVLVPVQTHFIETPQNITNPCTDSNHLFLAPGVLTAGGTSRACVSRFYPVGPARMTLSLHCDGEVTTATRELPPGDGGCLDINVPLKPNSKAELNVNLRYPEAGCMWSGRLSVRIAGGRAVVVHTERARYRPGDTVRLRAVVLRADLTPAHGHIDEIWIEGPGGAWEGARAAQWQRVRTRLGLAQLVHDLDELAPPGKWRVTARLADGSQGSATFSVGNYELPPFQLTVRHAPKVLRTSERLVWTVCVRYPWSEAVEGMLVIRLRGAGGAGSRGAGVRTAVRLTAPRACHRHAAAARRIGLDGDSAPDVVVADFSFQEEGTRVWQNTTVVSQVVDDPVTLEFLTKDKSVISPGLPYKLKVKATRWDDKPAANEQVRVCRTPVTSQAAVTSQTSNATCVEAASDSKGVAVVLFSPEENASPFYSFQASINKATAILTLACRSQAGRAALGPLRPDRGRALLPLYLNLGNVTTPLTVHFVVITRIGIIYRWGATTQCPVTTNTNQIQTAPRDSHCGVTETPLNEVLKRNVTDMDALLDRHLLRVFLPIKISNQMCPDSRVVVYFYHNGELVSASKHFEMEECFGNKVEASWVSRQVSPGSPATLQLVTPGPALCALSVLDTASKWLQTPPSVRDVLMMALKKLIDAHRNLTEHDAAGECFFSTDTPELPSTSSALMRSWLAAAGAWLWRLVAVGSNGSASATARAPDSISRFEASAYCLSRSGLAVAQPAVLQVFRELFIHADGARRLRRGDRTVLRYRLFNYLYTPLCVDIQVLTDPHIDGGEEQRACIAPRSAAARRTELRARLAGAAQVRLRATATNVTDGRVVSDEVLIKIQIDPEGVPVQEHKSIMLCTNGTEQPAPQSVSWSWAPVPAVPGTERLRLWASGDAMGPLFADADALVSLPRGCGEQNMARLATNLLAVELLPPRSAASAQAVDHVARGFTRQLQYAHRQGGFSAFGAADRAPSVWLTAFCLRYLRRAYRVVSPGQEVPAVITRAERWLRAQHMENGCFRNDGQLFHRDLRGGMGEESELSTVVLTAYVVTSLVEGGARLDAATVRDALACLRAPLPARPYARAVVAYAFVRIARYEEELRRTNEASLEKKGVEESEQTRQLTELLKVARRSGDYVWWEGATLSSSIEATGYALLALRECGRSLREHCAAAARAAAAWLAAHRSPTGGFVATQDTLVALEGLSRWALPPSNVTVRVGGRRLTLEPGAKLPELVHLEPAALLDVHIEGDGCALVQATRSYNTQCEGAGCKAGATGADRAFSVQVSVHTDGPFDCTANDTFCYCAAVVEACVVWSGQLPEMALLEVTLPAGYGADAAQLYRQLDHDDALLRRIELTASGSKATLYLSGVEPLETSGHRCYRVPATGPRLPTAPQHVTLLDYYAPHVEHTQMYVIPEDCPVPISHDTDDYNPTDNLFTKAKSLTDDGEILITHEFSFEDIPDGVPLDDPMYENLTQRKDDETSVNGNEKIEETRSIIDLNDITNNENVTTKTIIALKQINQNKKTVQIENDDEEHDTKKNNESEIPIQILSEQVDENANIIQTDELRTANAGVDSKLAVDEAKNVNAKYTIQGTNVNVEGVTKKLTVSNPMLSEFHVIESEKDLEVPSGVEGPVASVALPPGDFVFIPPGTDIPFSPHQLPEVSRRHFPEIPRIQFPRDPLYKPFQGYHNYRDYRHQR